MPLAILPLADPPLEIPALLEHIASLFTLVFRVDMLAAHICREPCASDLDSLRCHVAKVAQLEAVVVGLYGVEVGWTDPVRCASIRSLCRWASENGG